MSTQEGVVDLGNSEIQAPETFEKQDVRRIKMKKGEVMRIVILEEAAIMRLRHFMQGKGYTRCLAYRGWCPGCVASEKNSPHKLEGLKKATEVFGLNVFKYETEKTDADPAALKDGKVKGDIFLFNFGSEKFTAIRSLKKMYGHITYIDLQVTCTDGDFQKMAITAYPEPSWYASLEKVKAYIDKKYEQQKYPVEKLLCKEVSPKKMIELYGINPSLLETDDCKRIMIEYAEESKKEDKKKDGDDGVDISLPTTPASSSTPPASNIQASATASYQNNEGIQTSGDLSASDAKTPKKEVEVKTTSAKDILDEL